MAAGALLVAAALSAAAGPEVATTDGPVRGQAATAGVSLFRGIPFAAPPVGPLRWRPPAPVTPWTEVRDATVYTPACPQIDAGWNHLAAAHQSEDCLYLEVATPNLHPPTPLPVMVWIHGGGNRAGGGAGSVSPDLARKGVVVVAVQYRLGALGFMAHPALTAESPTRSSGNYALMDQQAALRWVQGNIARFGGDPANVTIFGESAGAQDVGLQLLSPGARGLFAKAIEESGTAGFGVAPRTLRQGEALGQLLASNAGAPARATAADLRALSADALVQAAERTDVPDLADDSFIWLQALVDGVVLTETPEASLKAGHGSSAPLIIGSNARELSLHGGSAQARTVIAEAFGPGRDRALAAYGLSGADATPVLDPRLGDLDAQLATDLTFRCPAVSVARARAKAGFPVWQYQYDYTPPDGSRVRHSAEIPYVMGAGAPGEAAPPMQAYWVNFARTGDPNGGDLPHWSRFDLKSRAYLGFVNGPPQPGSDLRAEICAMRDAP